MRPFASPGPRPSPGARHRPRLGTQHRPPVRCDVESCFDSCSRVRFLRSAVPTPRTVCSTNTVYRVLVPNLYPPGACSTRSTGLHSLTGLIPFSKLREYFSPRFTTHHQLAAPRMTPRLCGTKSDCAGVKQTIGNKGNKS